MEIDSGLTLYDLNKQIYAKEKPLDPIAFNVKISDMVNDLFKKQPYWMLLCRERNDYTVFIMLTDKGTIKELTETLNNRGQVMDIDKLEDGNYEIWIRDIDTQEVFVYYFFDYKYGIIQA